MSKITKKQSTPVVGEKPNGKSQFKHCGYRGWFVKPCKLISPHKMQIKTKRPLRVGLFGIGLNAYWPQSKGQILEIGNTNSRYRFSIGARKFVNDWNAHGPAHHCAVGVGHIANKINKLGLLLGLEIARV